MSRNPMPYNPHIPNNPIHKQSDQPTEFASPPERPGTETGVTAAIILSGTDAKNGSQPISQALVGVTSPAPADAEGETEAARTDVEATIETWRKAHHRDCPHAPISVDQEVTMRRCLMESEAAKRGLSLHAAVPQPAVQSLSEFLKRECRPKEPLIEGLLYRRDIVAFAGRRRHGKTTFTSNLGLALTLPRTTFLGYPIPDAVRVLGLFLEDDAGELQSKLRRMCKGQSPEAFALYTREDFYRAAIPIDITKHQLREFLGDSVEGNRDSGLIVISIPGRSEQPSERSDAGRRILQKVITIVKEKVLPSP